MNTEIWDKCCKVPPEAQKKIGDGRLKGMTDISPIWRYRKMTELFGSCGVGWKYKIVDLFTETDGKQIACFIIVELQYRQGDEWSEPVPGIGGSMLLAQESKGLYFSDEAYKMALTDAIGAALKMVGVAADIYAGQADSKYATPGQNPLAPLQKKLADMAKAKGFSKTGYYNWLDENQIDSKTAVGLRAGIAAMEQEKDMSKEGE